MAASPPHRRARIAAAFGAADDYDSAAIVQRAAAERLAGTVAALRLPEHPRILELGCGTGFVTRAIDRAVGGARWTISDIAPAMVDRARARLGLDADYRVLDGEAVDPAIGPFDLIVSGMAFQWFADLPAALARLAALLAPGGALAFSTMAEGSLAEWTEALAAEGLPAGLPAYPGRAALAAMAPPGFDAEVTVVDLPEPQADARTFLRGLKTIGAGTAAGGYRPLPPAALRRAMARFDAGPRRVTYRIGFCLLRARA
ncbi:MULTISPECIES: methyltransferase domain-containing protein [unclassified Sphingomonas]|uniref:methyltransferase domain-containing protein n=1 Tax=unclassified Sphingomonas TaxID=196159 RepID=UPI00070102A2|nr:MULTISPECIES: methyltransferase domain-containing protein [unclassified Sphingomonas]KQX21628.1 methyltransferase type 11 [Sphingomonas sp. Root1294]KQY72945.1 methyltransferase type 11 [Sphingomonas sp. Root50]KRB88262.1 methyltransferase type 11 [Sphingomonas sp. Root720]